MGKIMALAFANYFFKIGPRSVTLEGAFCGDLVKSPSVLESRHKIFCMGL